MVRPEELGPLLASGKIREMRGGDLGRGWKPREPMPLSELEHRMAELNRRLSELKHDGLSIEEVVSARLYTGPMFVKYNDLLRGFGAALEGCKGNAYVSTTHGINSAVVKMSKITRATKVYRGMTGGRLPPSFLTANEYGVKGGIEMSFMSTTYDRSVALKYASDLTKPGLVFEMAMGMVDRGADLEEISQYPTERECLFAPLTGIEVVRTRVEGSLLIVEARLSINLNSLTIDQVVNKRKKLLNDVAVSLRGEVFDELHRAMASRGGATVAWVQWAQFRADLASRIVQEGVLESYPPEWFNRDECFKQAMQTAVNVKIAMAKMTPGEIILDDCKVR